LILTEQHEQIRRSIYNWIDKEINPHVQEWEDAESYPAKEIVRQAGKLGFLGINKPVEFGGLGLDYSYHMMWPEALGHITAGGIASSLGVQTDMCTPALAKHGSDELRREFLEPAIAGELLGSIGVSETGAGSDVASIKTVARKDGGDYVINGGKMWNTNGSKADFCCVLCNTSNERAPHHNKSLIIVPLETKGVDRATKHRTFGLWASETTQIFFDEVRVPQRYCIGEENRGFIYQMEQFQEERLFAGARTITQMQELIDITIEYTRDRVAFGKPLLDNQWIHYTLAELSCDVQALRSMQHDAAERHVRGEDVRLLTAHIKLMAGRLARKIPDTCLQFWGGAGFLWESRVSRMLRDSRLVAIGGGANEVMMAIICKELGMLPKGGK
jgi:citronellyl-CoA dehydrogenase